MGRSVVSTLGGAGCEPTFNLITGRDDDATGWGRSTRRGEDGRDGGRDGGLEDERSNPIDLETVCKTR
jgi:hypothetical protein